MAMSDVLRLLTVVPTDTGDFQRALSMRLGDFEDAVHVACALKIDADFIIARDAADFNGAPITVRSAGEVLALTISAIGMDATLMNSAIDPTLRKSTIGCGCSCGPPQSVAR